MNEGCGFSGVALVVATETPVAADPGQGAFDDPTFRQHDEATQVRALDDIDCPSTGPCHDGLHLRSLIAAVADDALDEGKPLSGLPQQRFRTVAILNIGRDNIDIQQQAERVDEDVALSAEDFLARIEALAIKRGPPFTAPLALWASMMAVVGLASRPPCSRLWI